MPVELIGIRKGREVFDASKEIIGRYIKGVGEKPQVVKRRFTGAGFKVGDRGWLKVGALRQLALTETAILARGPETGREHI